MSDEGKTINRSGMPRPVVAFVVTVTLLACAGLAGSLTRMSVTMPELWWQFALCVGLLITASVPWLSARIGSQRMEFYWTDAAVAVTLTLLPLPWVVPTVAVGASVALVRQRHQPIKALFNTASPVLGATLSVGVLAALLGTGRVDASLRDVAAVMLGALVFGTWTDVAAAAVIGLAQRRSVLTVYRAGLSTNLLGAAGNLVATAAVLAMVRIDPRVLLVVPALLIVLHQAYVGRMRSKEERESWQGLLEATRTLSDLDERVVLATAVAEATRLFGADVAEVELTGGRLVRGSEQGVDHDGPADAAPPRDAGTVVERPIGPDAAPLGVLRLCFGAAVRLDRP